MITISRVSSLIALLSLGACLPTLTDDNVTEVSANEFCKKHRACDSDLWKDTFQEDFEECQDDLKRGFDTAKDVGALVGIEVDLREAKQCLQDLRSASCDDFNNDDYSTNCDDVYSF